MHENLIPPEVEDEEKLDWTKIPWATEYDVCKGLREAGHQVRAVGIYENLRAIREMIKEFKPHIVFNLLEEFRGEAVFDQNVVSYLELLQVPYTGCNPKGLIIARDKALSKKILNYHKISTPKFQVFPRNQPRRKVRLKEFPLIVKCLNEEASRGLSRASIVHNENKLRERVQFIHKNFNTDAIAEEFIKGDEYFVGVIGNYRLETLPVWALKFDQVDNPEEQFYSTNAKFNYKYRVRKGISTGPAQVSDDLTERLQKCAKRAYRALGLNGYARMDMRVDEAGKIYVLEANPNPDISEFEDFSESASVGGYSYQQLLNKVISLGKQWNPTDP